MKTQSTALHLLVLATFLTVLAILAGGLAGNLASSAGGPSPFTSARVLSSVCPAPQDGAGYGEIATIEKPLPFSGGAGEASGEHNRP
jgi:hypothetical protein